MATPDMDVIKEIPGYKVILKAILKSQIQQLVEQLASHTDEESVILTASVSDGTLCHLGSDSGKSFLEDHEDIKSQFLGFCLKRHHRRKQVEKEKINMPMARGPPMLPTHLGPGPGTRPQFNRSPRIPYPRQAMPRHSMSPGGGLSSIRSPAMRHEPYPTSRPIRRASLDSAGEAGGLLNQIPLKLPPGGMPKVDNQVIKVEAIDSPENSNNANDSELTSQLPSSSHCSPSLAAIAADNDDKSNSSSSTIPNEPIDTKLNIEGLGSVSGDQDVNSDSAAAKDSADPTSVSNTSTSGVDIDPDINVKVEAITESEMELEITGVEPGKMPVVGSAPQDNWVPDGQGGMYDPSGAMGNPEDMQAYKYAGLDNQKATSSSDNQAGLHLSSFSLTKRDVPKLLHQGVDLDGSTPYSVYEDAAVNANLFSIYNQSISYPEEKRQSKAAAEEGKWKCELCGKCCRTRWKLDTHMRVHTGEKPFECQICQKKFNAKGNMKTHMMVHYK